MAKYLFILNDLLMLNMQISSHFLLKLKTKNILFLRRTKDLWTFIKSPVVLRESPCLPGSCQENGLEQRQLAALYQLLVFYAG